jgi:hypothetical protein
MKYLDFVNLCDESLGLTKEIYPSLSILCSFHQLCLFPAAKYFYSQKMMENESIYFLALLRLRTCVVNLRLPRTDIFSALFPSNPLPVPGSFLPF